MNGTDDEATSSAVIFQLIWYFLQEIWFNSVPEIFFREPKK